MGRWTSDAYRLYTRAPSAHTVYLSTLMASEAAIRAVATAQGIPANVVDDSVASLVGGVPDGEGGALLTMTPRGMSS